VIEKRRDLLDKLKAIGAKREAFEAGTASPGSTVIERVLGPCEIVIGGRPTLMFGSNNYLGLTFDPEVIAAAREAILQYGTGTTGSRTANGTLSLHEDLERALADWFGKKHALIFSTGYQANLSVIGGLCGPHRAVRDQISPSIAKRDRREAADKLHARDRVDGHSARDHYGYFRVGRADFLCDVAAAG